MQRVLAVSVSRSTPVSGGTAEQYLLARCARFSIRSRGEDISLLLPSPCLSRVLQVRDFRLPVASEPDRKVPARCEKQAKEEPAQSSLKLAETTLSAMIPAGDAAQT